MKSTPHSSIPNLRGKKSYAFSCGCCACSNKKDDYNKYLAKKEIENYTRYVQTDGEQK